MIEYDHYMSIQDIHQKYTASLPDKKNLNIEALIDVKTLTGQHYKNSVSTRDLLYFITPDTAAPNRFFTYIWTTDEIETDFGITDDYTNYGVALYQVRRPPAMQSRVVRGRDILRMITRKDKPTLLLNYTDKDPAWLTLGAWITTTPTANREILHLIWTKLEHYDGLISYFTQGKTTFPEPSDLGTGNNDFITAVIDKLKDFHSTVEDIANLEKILFAEGQVKTPASIALTVSGFMLHKESRAYRHFAAGVREATSSIADGLSSVRETIGTINDTINSV